MAVRADVIPPATAHSSRTGQKFGLREVRRTLGFRVEQSRLGKVGSGQKQDGGGGKQRRSQIEIGCECEPLESRLESAECRGAAGLIARRVVICRPHNDRFDQTLANINHHNEKLVMKRSNDPARRLSRNGGKV